MAQVPVTEVTFATLVNLRNESMVKRSLRRTTWDNVVVSLLKVAEQHPDEYDTAVMAIPNGNRPRAKAEQMVDSQSVVVEPSGDEFPTIQ